jgi:hypothetical protein
VQPGSCGLFLVLISWQVWKGSSRRYAWTVRVGSGIDVRLKLRSDEHGGKLRCMMHELSEWFDRVGFANSQCFVLIMMTVTLSPTRRPTKHICKRFQKDWLHFCLTTSKRTLLQGWDHTLWTWLSKQPPGPVCHPRYQTNPTISNKINQLYIGEETTTGISQRKTGISWICSWSFWKSEHLQMIEKTHIHWTWQIVSTTRSSIWKLW